MSSNKLNPCIARVVLQQMIHMNSQAVFITNHYLLQLCHELLEFNLLIFSFQKCVTALNATWHPEHFFCAQCGRPFGDDGFHEKDGKAFCRADYFEMFAPKCGGCARAIVDNYISALSRHWHPECFACWVSRK